MEDVIIPDESQKKEEVVRNLSTINECGVDLLIDENAISPKKSEVFYNKEMSLNRTIVATALGAYVESGKSVFQPVRCLDAIGATGISGLTWKKSIPNDIAVTINDCHDKAFDIISQNANLNNLDVTVLKKDACVLLHEQPFNFIFLDCHGASGMYMDSAFRNLPKNGILAVSVTDDAALYGKSPEIALRNYGGYITKTFYSKELAVRLIISAIAKGAAHYNKGIRVLCTVAFKASFLVIVQAVRGPTHANESLQNIRKLIHCNICEDRAFYPATVYPVEEPYSLLGCSCHANLPGKLATDFGPIWGGDIFCIEFIRAMLKQTSKFSWAKRSSLLLEQILTEAICPKGDLPMKTLSCDENDKSEDNGQSLPKKPRLTFHDSDHEKKENLRNNNSVSQAPTTPAFYFNLHRHSPKGPQLLRADKAVQCLHQAGYRASRTHFDREAVRTDASLSNLIDVLKQCSSQVKK